MWNRHRGYVPERPAMPKENVKLPVLKNTQTMDQQWIQKEIQNGIEKGLMEVQKELVENRRWKQSMERQFSRQEDQVRFREIDHI